MGSVDEFKGLLWIMTSDPSVFAMVWAFPLASRTTYPLLRNKL